MKQIFAYLLLTIIAFQVLPLKEVSALIYGKQMVEEICYASTDADGTLALLAPDKPIGPGSRVR